jgi:hypothetical protein
LIAQGTPTSLYLPTDFYPLFSLLLPYPWRILMWFLNLPFNIQHGTLHLSNTVIADQFPVIIRSKLLTINIKNGRQRILWNKS